MNYHSPASDHDGGSAAELVMKPTNWRHQQLGNDNAGGRGGFEENNSRQYPRAKVGWSVSSS